MCKKVVDFRFGQVQALSSVVTSFGMLFVGMLLVARLGAPGLVFVGLGLTSLLLGMRFRVRVTGDALEVRNLRRRTYLLNSDQLTFFVPSGHRCWPGPRSGLWVGEPGSRPVLAWATWRGRAYPSRSVDLTMLLLLLKERSPESKYLPLSASELSRHRRSGPY